MEVAPGLLPDEEPEASALLADILRGEGITLQIGRRATMVTHDGSKFSLALRSRAMSSNHRLSGRSPAVP